MRILVTGGAGFIGSWVTEAYLKAHHEVAVLDDLSTGSLSNIPLGAHFFQMDIRDTHGVARALQEFRPEIVNHHAAQVNLQRSVTAPVNDAEINVIGTVNLIEQCIKHQAKKIIFASTGGAIYGDADIIPTKETAPTLPSSPYGVTKLAGEHYLRVFQKSHGLDFVALRYANVYGPRQAVHAESGVVAIFCDRIFENREADLYGDGLQSRDYVFAADIAEANLLAIDAPHGVYNLGTKKETTLLDLIAALEAATGMPLTIVSRPARLAEVRRSALDPSLAFSNLGWAARTSLEDGLKLTWQWRKGQ